MAAAVLSIFEVGADGLARARLPFDAHMAILDDLLDTDHEALWGRIRCPTWLVSCEPMPAVVEAGPAEVARTELRAAALDRAGTLLARPRLQRWQGAVHDVPLQWPALVAGLLRAAVQEVSGVHGSADGEGAPS